MGTENMLKEMCWCVVLIAGNDYLNDKKKECFLCLQSYICLYFSDRKDTST